MQNMEVEKTKLLDCVILTPKKFGDKRGFFESITKEQLLDAGFSLQKQLSDSQSQKGVLRGLHFQKDPYCQAKVVRCVRGAVLDVVVDMRIDSPTYGEYVAVELTQENGKMLYVPRGFAHAYLCLKDDSLFEYFVDNKYMPKYEGGILWNDPALNIPWDEYKKKYDIKEFILSEKDKVRETLKECPTKFKREKTRYLITGYKGQLGYDIVRELEERGERDYLALDVAEMDITNKEQVLKIVKDYNPDVIFHCAAWTAVDKAEKEEEKVRKVNVEGTKNIVDASLEVDAKVVYMSTDYVFDGKKEGYYSEDDQTHPMSVYGKTKYEGEEEVRRNPKHFIPRISWVFGINGNNFIKTMINLSETKDQIPVVKDQIGSPTYTVDLANRLVEMVHTEKYGTYHVNNDGYCSWADFADYIFKSNGMNTKVIPITTEEYIESFGPQAYRPRNSKLSKEKLENAGFLKLPSWQDAVTRYCNELENHSPCLKKIRRSNFTSNKKN